MLGRQIRRNQWVTVLLLLLAAGGASLTAHAQGVGQPIPAFVPGELVVRVAPGVNADQLAAQFGLQVGQRLRFRPDTVVLQGVQGPVDAMAAQLARQPGVVCACPNVIFRKAALPQVVSNDTLVRQQWALPAMGVPDAWGIAVGERFVGGPRKTAIVGLIDEGPLTSHPDLVGQFDPNGFDFGRDAPYDEKRSFPGIGGHGTAMASGIAPITNNGEGLSGTSWEGVRILPCAINELFAGFSILTGANLLDAIYYCIQQQVDVVNMSLGSSFNDPLIEQAVKDAYAAGLIMVAATGNERSFGFNPGVSFPAAYDEVIAVGATGPANELATYSNMGPETDLSAPGGNSPFNDPAASIVAANSENLTPGDYSFIQGTSISTAFVSGIAAMLIAQGALEAVDEAIDMGVAVPSDRVDAMYDLLTSTANNPTGAHHPGFGFGIVDAGAALRSSTHHVEITSPLPNEVTESFTEPFAARIIQTMADPLEDGDFSLTQNGVDVTDRVQILDEDTGTIEYEPDVDTRYQVGRNRLDLTFASATMPNAERSLGGPAVGTIPERAYQFILRPRVLHAGIRMFSIPYELSDDLKDRTPEGALRFLFGGNLIRMARWVPEEVRYAIFDLVGSPQEDEATLTLNSSGVAQPPAGAAFWARITEPGGPPPPPEEGGGLTPRGTQVQLLGRSIRSAFYRIRLQPGWNMVGNPYTFRVAYNACIVQLPGQFGTEIVPIQEAVRRGAIRPQIWRFVDGLYTFKTLPDGELIDWEGHWIYSNLAVDFLVPRIRSGFFSTASVDGLLRGDERIAAAAGPGALPHGGWAFPWGAAEECALSRATNAAAAAVQSSKGVRAGRSGRPAAVLRWATHTAPGRAPRPAAGRGDRAI